MIKRLSLLLVGRLN